VIIGADHPGPLTGPARTLFLTHEPGVWAYLSRAFGRPVRPADLVAVDAAYVELAFGGLVAQVEATFTVLAGERRRPFVLTPAGERARTALNAVPVGEGAGPPWSHRPRLPGGRRPRSPLRGGDGPGRRARAARHFPPESST
jgi:hypothetical protein